MKNKIKIKKTIAAFVFMGTLAVALIISGSTLAWFTDTTETVKNTFTTSNINVELKETTGTDYQMIPGHTITKDPEVTVLANSEKCYVFVKLEKSADFDDFMTYEMAEGWTSLTGAADVYYRVVDKGTQDQAFEVIKDDQVQVKDTVTKDMMDDIQTEEGCPTLTVTAYAVQFMKSNTTEFEPAEAWDIIF